MATQVRASDREREEVAERLREALADGRLDADELEERLQRAYAARTQSELAVLTEDLPAPASGAAPRHAWVPHVVPGRAFHLVTFVVINALLVGLWMADVGARDPLIVGDTEFPWPILIIVAWASVIALSARRDRQSLPRGSRRQHLPAQQP